MDYVDQAKFDELRRHSYINGDIVMTKLGNPLGESAVVEGLEEGLIVADLVRIRAKNINTQYLCYHLNSRVTSAYINSQQKGTTRPRVRITVVRDLPIYTPSLDEQQHIVASLDKLSMEVQQLEKGYQEKLNSLEELKKSLLQKAFSGELTKAEGHAA
jgi:type I restriction enzyme S subunit